jgi:hypothetical protein
MATGKIMSMPPSLHASEAEDWLDHEIASLRELVESEAPTRAAPRARRAPWGVRIREARRKRARARTRRALQPQIVRRLRWLVSSHRLEIAFVALSVAMPLAAMWLIFSIAQP